jgi:hypothetical protein
MVSCAHRKAPYLLATFFPCGKVSVTTAYQVCSTISLFPDPIHGIHGTTRYFTASIGWIDPTNLND